MGGDRRGVPEGSRSSSRLGSLDGRCGCASDADCKGAELDRCYAGTCGCSSAAACPPSEVFDNTTVVCQ